MKIIFTLIVSFLFTTILSGQKDSLMQQADSLPDKFYLLHNIKRDGESMPEVEIKEVTVIGRPGKKRRNEHHKTIFRWAHINKYCYVIFQWWV